MGCNLSGGSNQGSYLGFSDEILVGKSRRSFHATGILPVYKQDMFEEMGLKPTFYKTSWSFLSHFYNQQLCPSVWAVAARLALLTLIVSSGQV